ncbi:hypothetical protein [Micromonospora globbae]|uniref:hypothetical protein n=1 Tax=Micromonospora globbae TaxID=1894969 RepID=UPI0034214AEC
MGYTHYWSVPLSHRDYATAWPTLIDDTRRIIGAVRATGVVIAGPDGYRRPVLDPAAGIEFNGDATTDLDYEAFVLQPPSLRPGYTRAFCKTGRRPYDLAVAAVLLRARLLLPDVFLIRSDGSWDGEWAHGVLPGIPGAGHAVAPRQLVADLFGPVPQRSPFHPTTLPYGEG